MRTISMILSSGLLMSSLYCSAQAPIMGSTAGFAMFTSIGAITNNATSHLTGNIGTNSGSITGFGNVNGVMHSGDGATLTAVTDLQNVYTQLDTITPTTPHAPLLGNGDTLTPGIYSISGNTVIDQVLYLNASGNQNAVFIFQIDGTLSVNGLAAIQLLNGAQACNIFWKVEGLISAGTGSKLKGTFLANNAAVDIASNVSLEGRILSTAGAVSVSNALIFTPTGCGSPILNGPAAPALGSTATYALFTGNGANLNAGSTIAEGDVGTNVGLTDGYNPLLVNGTIHPEPDSSTALCAADLINVHTYLNTLPADIELLYPAQFGNSLVLTPHTYLLNAATTLTDTLFLDAQGNANAVFVIKVEGALSTSTYATVVLMNNAVAANVFWKVDGAVDINDYSIFKGTIVCNNGAIDLGTGSQITGRALTTNGAFNADAVNIVMPIPNNNIVLAGDWLYFTGKSYNNDVILKWGTTGMINSGIFNIERSTDGRTFEQLKSVPVTDSKDNKENHYSVTDQHPLPKALYRISVVTNDNKVNYFLTIEVTNNTVHANTEIFYPNPWKDRLNITVADASPTHHIELAIYNIVGAKVYTNTIIGKQTNLDVHLPSGVYYYQLTAPNVKVRTGKIISE